MIKKIILIFLVFLGALCWFVWNGSWYHPVQIRVDGFAPEENTTITMEWDSGSGFNGYERKKFPLNTVLPAGESQHEIIIRYTGERSSASLSKEIVCRAISIDGKPVYLDDLASEGVKLKKDGLHLARPGAEIRLSGPAEKNIHIELLTNNHSGIAEVSINGINIRYDLYMANVEAKTMRIDRWIKGKDGRFAIWLDMPRYSIEKFVIKNQDNTKIRFTGVQLAAPHEEQNILHEEKVASQLVYFQINKGNEGYFHPVQFGLQLVFAALTTWIVMALVSLIGKYDGFADFLVNSKRYMFWTFFLVSICCYTVWLAAFWPGVMSVDSLKIWRAAMLPEVFLNDHPLLNVVFYMYLMGLWNNVAVVPVAHILLTSLLSATIFFWLYRRGISLYLLLPFYLLLVSSIPVGLYNLMLWKDIPFALLVVFWGYTMVRLYELKKEGGRISFQYGLLLVLLLLALALVRHNGVVYLVYIPVLFLVLGFCNLKKMALVSGGLIIACSLIFLIFRSSGYVDDANYVSRQGKVYLKQVSESGVGSRILQAGHDYMGILNINQTDSKWDLFHYYLYDRQAYRFLSRSGWHDSYPYFGGRPEATKSFRKDVMQLYQASYTSPWVYFTWNPVYILALFPFVLILFYWLPRSAIYSSVFLIQVAALLIVVHVLNWRYYYFIYLGSFFLIPMIILDVKSRVQHQSLHGSDAF